MSTAKAKRENIITSVLLVPLSLVVCGLLSALTIFIYMSHLCLQSGFSIDDPSLKLSGAELSFNVLPKALMMLPLPNLWVFIFFSTMVLLAIDSEFGLLETLYCYVRDEFGEKEISIFGFKIGFRGAQKLTLLLTFLGAPTLSSHAGIFYL